MKILIVGLIIIIGTSVLGFSSCIEPAAQEIDGDEIVTDEILNNVMDYVKRNHLDAAPFIRQNIIWVQSNAIKRVGYTGSTYNGDGWTVIIGHAVTAEIIYEVRAEYSDEGIIWVGTIKDDAIIERSYERK